MSARSQDCPRCGLSDRLNKRAFSDQALAALVIWGELDRELISEAICDGCYDELRDILIDRSGEVLGIDPTSLHRAS